MQDTNNNFGSTFDHSTSDHNSNSSSDTTTGFSENDNSIDNQKIQKVSSSAEDDMSPMEKKILKAEENVRKLKEKAKLQKKQQKEKHEQEIIKLLNSEGLLKASLGTWSSNIKDISDLLNS